ncbi:cholecystokinin receptor isoform X2 [Lingula anatina]|uniref:Gastrin/cholecystokinin type B receptor n=1 Tax=Lingula anatina TaxID=7574 RepID=A0A1S3K864_LINAN|nr:cholecystokinin receptor isoform X2 [Lingula anatina]|eukprot:XP_013418687.1 cholecystokinin receptor isoform X2 [Lingula anatina]
MEFGKIENTSAYGMDLAWNYSGSHVAALNSLVDFSFPDGAVTQTVEMDGADNTGNETYNFTRSETSEIPGEILIPLYSLIFLLSVVGNGLVIATLVQNKRMRTVTNMFLLNLSISDLLLAVLCMPVTIIPTLLRDFIFGEVMCIMIRYLQAVSAAVSVFTLVAISLERYCAICRPLHSRSWQTLSHSYKTIAAVWSTALVIMIPIAVVHKYWTLPNGNHKCDEDWGELVDLRRAYTVFLDVVLLVLPLEVMLVAYGLIARTLWIGIKMEMQGQQELRQLGSNRDVIDDEVTTNGNTCSHKRMDFEHSAVRRSNAEKSLAAKKRVIRMLFVIVLEFFICWTPLYALYTWVDFDKASARKHLTAVCWSLIQLLSYVSACCNPITYCFMNKKFRHSFLAAFRCIRPKLPPQMKRGRDSDFGSPATGRSSFTWSFRSTEMSRVSERRASNKAALLANAGERKSALRSLRGHPSDTALLSPSQ